MNFTTLNMMPKTTQNVKFGCKDCAKVVDAAEKRGYEKAGVLKAIARDTSEFQDSGKVIYPESPDGSCDFTNFTIKKFDTPEAAHADAVKSHLEFFEDDKNFQGCK